MFPLLRLSEPEKYPVWLYECMAIERSRETPGPTLHPRSLHAVPVVEGYPEARQVEAADPTRAARIPTPMQGMHDMQDMHDLHEGGDCFGCMCINGVIPSQRGTGHAPNIRDELILRWIRVWLAPLKEWSFGCYIGIRAWHPVEKVIPVLPVVSSSHLVPNRRWWLYIHTAVLFKLRLTILYLLHA